MTIRSDLNKYILETARKQALGAGAVGALAGAVAGYKLSEKEKKLKGTLAGALGGGLVGGTSGYFLTKALARDKDLLQRISRIEALQSKQATIPKNIKQTLDTLDIRNLPGEIQREVLKRFKKTSGLDNPKKFLSGVDNFPGGQKTFKEYYAPFKEALKKDLIQPYSQYATKLQKTLKSNVNNLNAQIKRKSIQKLTTSSSIGGAAGIGSTALSAAHDRKKLEKKITRALRLRNNLK